MSMSPSSLVVPGTSWMFSLRWPFFQDVLDCSESARIADEDSRVVLHTPTVQSGTIPTLIPQVKTTRLLHQVPHALCMVECHRDKDSTFKFNNVLEMGKLWATVCFASQRRLPWENACPEYAVERIFSKLTWQINVVVFNFDFTKTVQNRMRHLMLITWRRILKDWKPELLPVWPSIDQYIDLWLERDATRISWPRDWHMRWHRASDGQNFMPPIETAPRMWKHAQ